jgi:N-acetylmuramoyl-L-alanine amidase
LVSVVVVGALVLAVVAGGAGDDGEVAGSDTDGGAAAPWQDRPKPGTDDEALDDGVEEPAPAEDGDAADDATDAEEVVAPPLEGVVVALDPGHNTGDRDALDEIARPIEVGEVTRPCNTPGGTAPDGTPEPAITLAIAQQVAERLEALGAQVELTREDDEGVGPCIDERARFGAEVGADLFLSLYANDGPPEGAGFLILHALEDGSEADPDVVAAAEGLAGTVRDALLAADLAPVDYAGEAGVLGRDDLVTLNLVTVPGVLVDAGNLRNPDDAERLTSAAGQAQLADALVAAVTAYAGGD